MTSVIQNRCGESLQTSSKMKKENNFELVNRYNEMMKILKNENCSGFDQEVPESSYYENIMIKTEQEDTLSVDSSPMCASSFTILNNQPNYCNKDGMGFHRNIPTSVYRDDVPAASMDSPSHNQNFCRYTPPPQTVTPASSQSLGQLQQFTSTQNNLSYISSSTPSSSSSSLSSPQFWSTSSSPSPSRLTKQPVIQNAFQSLSSPSSVVSSVTSSSFMSTNSPVQSTYLPLSSSSSSPLLSSSASSSSLSLSPNNIFSDAKPRTFISELGGSGCTVIPVVPNFLSSAVNGTVETSPCENQEESLQYMDLDRIPENLFYEDLSLGNNKTTINQTKLDESSVPLEQVVDFMRSQIEADRTELNLPCEPQCWSRAEVARWVKWVCQKNGVEDISNRLNSLDGATLCSYHSNTLESAYGHSGTIVFQELELWKSASSYNETSLNGISSIQMPFYESSEFSLTPSVSPSPSNMSNSSQNGNQMFPSSFDNSEDEVFYPDHEIKQEITNLSGSTDKFGKLPFKPRVGRGHKKAITLWQFLLELLIGKDDNSDCIRWLNKESRIFKIENSKKVANLWGKVKSRPAMNYDKLSRSVRQYYRKGIIKKPEQTKRLVYQFCPGIC